MTTEHPTWSTQHRGWRTLKQLHPLPLDLSPLSALHAASQEELDRPAHLEALLLTLGLNDEGLAELPVSLHHHCGRGLRIWQYPIQFAPYLRRLRQLRVRSYLEVGVRHGGSFVATVESLRSVAPLAPAVAVDIIPSPGLAQYSTLNPHVTFECMNTQSEAFPELLRRLGRIDLVFIDSHHDEGQCRRELAAVTPHANMIALHDITNKECPGIGRVWADVRADPAFRCEEFTAQYEGLGPFMGIGLAVTRERWAASAGADPGGPSA